MLYAILTQIVVPVSVLALVSWAWSRWKADVPNDVPNSDVGCLSPEKADVSIDVPRSDVGSRPTVDEERARIKGMLDEELLPRGFTMHPSPPESTYARKFQYSKGALVLNVLRFACHDGDIFVCDAARRSGGRFSGLLRRFKGGAEDTLPVTDGASQRVTGFAKYGVARRLTEDQLAEFQRGIGAFLDAEGVD